MGVIASRSLQTTRKTQGWAAWIVLALPIIGIGSLVFESSQRVVKPGISLFQAVDNNDLSAIHAHALTGTNLNQLDASGHTALYEAIANENDIAAKNLVEYGASPNAEAKDSETPLMLASGQGDPELVNKLLGAGALPNAGTRTGMRALYEGACSGNAKVVAQLLKKGADPNATLGSFSATPLSVAAWQGNLSMVNELLCAGAKVNVHGYRGNTALDQAKLRHNDAVVKRLIAAGAKA